MPTAPKDDRSFAHDVVVRLRQAGFTALWAGGCVRDGLLGRTPKDYDVATDAKPAEVRKVLRHTRTLEVGAAFGVITAIERRAGSQVEVATFRQDMGYSDGRHPDAVTFSTPQEDAKRRDFTINGLFFDPVEEQVIDYVGGQADLAARVIRAIGDPRLRIAEDKLRMLRAVRFAAAYEFEIEAETAAAIAEMAEQINVVSPERIAQEMRRMLIGPRRTRALCLLSESGLLGAILPEAMAMHGVPQHKQRAPEADLWDHTLAVLDELHEPSFALALAALLHDVGKPRTMAAAGNKLSFYDHEVVGADMARAICRRWRLSRRDESRVVWLVLNHMYLGEARKMRWAKLQRMLSQTGVDELLDLHEADARASTGDAADVDYCRQLLHLPPEELNPPALLNGHDLQRHGVPEGQIYQQLLHQIYDAQLEKRIRSKRDALALVDQLLEELQTSPGNRIESSDCAENESEQQSDEQQPPPPGLDTREAAP